MDSLRIHIITEHDPFYLTVFFREFFEHLPRDGFVVTGLDITATLNQKSPLPLARKLLDFFGPIDFLRLGVRYAMVSMLNLLLPAQVYPGNIERIAAHHGVKTRTVPNVNDPAYVEGLQALQPDLLISVAASQIFRSDLLAVPRLEAINIHTGKLPLYRGMLPVFWQMLDQRPSITITIHTMTREIDLGDILLEREVPLGGDRTLDLVIRKMKLHGARALVDLLERYRSGSIQRVPMDRSQEGYRPFPRRADAVAFRRLGYRLL